MQKTILIVDDNATIRHLLADFFSDIPRSFEIHEAADGVEAVEKAPLLDPDLILMDLAMPRMNGLEASEKLRKLKIQSPIILFTLHARSVPEAVIEKSGINAVVLKTDFAALREQVETFLPDSRV